MDEICSEKLLDELFSSHDEQLDFLATLQKQLPTREFCLLNQDGTLTPPEPTFHLSTELIGEIQKAGPEKNTVQSYALNEHAYIDVMSVEEFDSFLICRLPEIQKDLREDPFRRKFLLASLELSLLKMKQEKGEYETLQFFKQAKVSEQRHHHALKDNHRQFKAIQEKEKLILQDKFSHLEQLAVSLAHEVNQPLTYISTIIQSTIDKLQRNKFDPEKMIAKFSKTIDQVARIKELTNHLRSLRWPGDEQHKQVDLSSVIDDSMSIMIDNIKQRNITFRCQIPEEMPPFWGSYHKLEQVIINLASNSIAAMENQADGEISISVVQETEQLTIRFADNGHGMSAEVKEKIFEPFFTTKEHGKGAGIGMGIVLDIVHEHKGEIICESEPGAGTTFIITFSIKNDSEKT